MKRLALIVGASSGWGHMKAASNISVALSDITDTWEIQTLNVFDFLPLGLGGITTEAWRFASRHSDLAYGSFYKALITGSACQGLVDALSHITATRLSSHVDIGRIGVYVATHSFAAAVGSQLKARYAFKLCVAATDFVLHSRQIFPNVDVFYMPPSFELRASMEETRMIHGRILHTGIPIAPEFAETKDKFHLRRKLGLCESPTTVLVSFGGEGLRAERHRELFDHLLSLGFPVQIIVLAGKNVGFERAMRENYDTGGYKDKIKIHAYRDDVSDFYAAADMFVGKAGGLSISEAISTRLPIVFVDMLPGQEEFNVRMITSLGLGEYVGDSLDRTWWEKALEASASLNRCAPLSAFARPRSSLLVANHIAALAGL